MKQIKYSPDAADKLRFIDKTISLQYGKAKAKKIVGTITGAIRDLAENEEKGPAVEAMFQIPCEYRYLFVSGNYIFYHIESDYIRIINIYNEKEDFMYQLFGIVSTSEDTIEYWGEE